jgi:hypothetical protein
VVEDVAADLVAQDQPAPLPELPAIVAEAAVGEADGGIDRHPGHQLRLREVTLSGFHVCR